jgi:hypothetical protein
MGLPLRGQCSQRSGGPSVAATSMGVCLAVRVPGERQRMGSAAGVTIKDTCVDLLWRLPKRARRTPRECVPCGGVGATL